MLERFLDKSGATIVKPNSWSWEPNRCSMGTCWNGVKVCYRSFWKL